MHKPPLSSVRILDFTWALAGPYGTMLLAFMGAQVIKVESMKARGPGASPTVSLNKLSIKLNLSTQKGTELAKKLVLNSDVVVDNFRPGVMGAFGLGYGDLSKIKPDIIVASSSNCGATGPERQYPGVASVFSSLGGLGYATGYPGGPPTELRWSIDLRVGAAEAFAIMAALYHRQRTGEGQFIDLSAREAISCLIGDLFMEYTLNGRNPVPRGNQDDIMAPHNCYPCMGDDKWVSIAVATEPEWKALSQAMGNPEWTKDEKFSDTYRRWQNQEELDGLVGAWTSKHSSYEVMKTLQNAGVAAVPSFAVDELVNDPHLKDRGALAELSSVEAGKATMVTAPWLLSKAPPVAYTARPVFGEHSNYVFGELAGLSKEEIIKLMDEQIIY